MPSGLRISPNSIVYQLSRARNFTPLVLDSLEPDPAIFVHVVGIGGIGEERHVAEDIVENVGLLQIVELRAAADEGPGRKLPVGQHLEKRP